MENLTVEKTGVRVSSWETVQDRQPDLRGIENPSEWNYIFKDGCFRPYERVKKQVVEVDPMYDELDPDMTDEQLIEMGFEIKYSVLIGDDGSSDIRDGLGHRVMVQNDEPKELRKIGF
jgi:hypothetical protein